jgi:hypothetical protein
VAIPESSSLLPAPSSLLGRHPWLTFLLPFVVHMLAGGIEPSAPKPLPAEQAESLSPEARAKMAEGTANTFGFRYKDYPIAYTIKIALTIAAILFVLPGYRQFPFHVSQLAVVVGVVGVVIWIAICQLHLEAKLLAPLGLDAVLGFGERPAYNPLDQLRDTPAWAYTFLAIRFLGLALVVPIVEEFFLRGFLMRFVMSDRW